MTKALLTCLSHTPLKGNVDPLPEVVDEVARMVAQLGEEVAAFDPELIFLFAPDHYNGFFLDAMPQLCIGTAAESVGDYSTSAGPLPVPRDIAEACAAYVVGRDIDHRYPPHVPKIGDVMFEVKEWTVAHPADPTRLVV